MVTILSPYLYHKALQSIQQHSPRHTDRSRDYMEYCLYSALNNFAYSPHRTIHQHILSVTKIILCIKRM